MKKLLGLFTVLTLLFICGETSFAFQPAKLGAAIESSDLNKTSTIAVSVKKLNGGTVYQKNELKLLHPASTMKLFSLYPSINSLGYNYYFKTEFYKDAQNNLYIKLGGDPLLTSSKLASAIKEVKAKAGTEFKNIYIDDSVLEKRELSEGWMWDNEFNPFTPKISAYNLDNNTFEIIMTKNSDNSVSMKTNPANVASIVSRVTAGNKSDLLQIERYNWLNPDVIEVYGIVKEPKNIKIPVANMRKYFINSLRKSLKDTGITVKETSFASIRTPGNANLITSILTPISTVLPEILQKSNNLYAETVFKLAGGNQYGLTGSDFASEKMFKEFYDKNGVKTNTIIVKDGCGISRNDLLSADWMTDALVLISKQTDFEKYKDIMAQPGDGTLSSRLYELRGSAWLKTGSLSNISAIAGYVTSQDGSTYAVTILTQNFNRPPKEVKAFEDELIRIIYNR